MTQHTSHLGLIGSRNWLLILSLFGGMALFNGPLFAQHPLYYPINEENGLPTDEIYEVVQDRFGLIWVASNSGLFSYDGVRVHRFSHPAEKSKATIAVIHDAQDHIWCRNVAGQVFKVVGDSLQMMLDPLPSQPMRSFAYDLDGGFCTLVGNMLLRYDANGTQRDSLQLDTALPESASVVDMAMRKEKVYLFVSKWGIYEADFVGGKQKRVLQTNEFITGGFNFKGEQLYLMLSNQKDQSKQLFQFHQNSFTLIYSTDSEDQKERWLRIVPSGPDRLWVCTVDGAFAIQKRGTTWEQGTRRFQEVPISSVLEDKEGITWFSTLSEGFLVMPSDEIIRLLPDNIPERENNMLTLCVLADGSLVAGTFAGSLFHLSPQSSGIQEIYPADRDVRKYPVRRILPYKNGVLVSKGLFSYADFSAKAMQKTAQLYHARDIALVGDTLFAVLPDKIIQLQVAEHLGSNISNSKSIHGQGGKAVELDAAGNLYFACNDGTYWLHGGVMEEVLREGKKLNLNFMHTNAQGVWAASAGIGLMLLQNGRITRELGLNDGLPDLNIRALHVFEEQVLFSTENDFCKLDLGNGHVTQLSSSVGFNPNHINDIAVSADRIWLATTKGIVSLPLAFSPSAEIKPSIRIRQVFVDDKAVAKSELLEIQDQNFDLRIEFEGISFRSRHQYFFEYRIVEIDTHWTRTPSEANFANYASLPSGSLTFEVRTVDENGIRSPEHAVLQLHVATPFHQQIWFFALLGILILLFSFALFQVRLRLLRRRHRIQEQLISSQLTALKAQMNPHFMFNALNSIQDFVISKDIRNSNLYLSKFSTLMRMVLNASDHNQVRLSDEIEMLQLYLDLEQLRFGSEMQYTIDCAAGMHPDNIFIPSMIIQPFVENAIKHGLLHKKGEKRLSIQFQASDVLICTITDNGVGRKRSAEIKARGVAHSSFSTVATVKRLDLIQSLYGAAVALEIVDLEDNAEGSVEAMGTRVEIKLPLMNANQPLVK